MRVARECFPYLGVGLAVGLAGFMLGYVWLGGMALALTGFVVFFFRDPERSVPSNPDLLVSPADGRVTQIVTLPSSGGTRISIFLSIFNVHVNRSPVSGVVEGVKYRSGRFLPANLSRSGIENERNDITLSTRHGVIRVAQIAGVVARRIVFWKRVGDKLEAGERIGLIQFGSRVEVEIPPGIVPLVQVGTRVRGGSTVLAQAPGHKSLVQEKVVAQGQS